VDENFGGMSIDPLLIQRWEGNEKQLRRTWSLAVLSAIDAGVLKVDTLGQYRRHFKDSKKFQKYLKTHPHHEKNLVEQSLREKNKKNEKYKKALEKEDFKNFMARFN